MYNFNKERWGMVAGGNRLSRLMVEECFKWAMSRMVFGRAHPTLRYPHATLRAAYNSNRQLPLAACGIRRAIRLIGQPVIRPCFATCPKQHFMQHAAQHFMQHAGATFNTTCPRNI